MEQDELRKKVEEEEEEKQKEESRSRNGQSQVSQEGAQEFRGGDGELLAGEKRSEQVLRGCTKQEDMSYDSEGSPNPLPIVPLEVQAEEACGGEKLAEGEGLAVFSSGGDSLGLWW